MGCSTNDFFLLIKKNFSQSSSNQIEKYKNKNTNKIAKSHSGKCLMLGKVDEKFKHALS